MPAGSLIGQGWPTRCAALGFVRRWPSALEGKLGANYVCPCVQHGGAPPALDTCERQPVLGEAEGGEVAEGLVVVEVESKHGVGGWVNFGPAPRVQVGWSPVAEVELV